MYTHFIHTAILHIHGWKTFGGFWCFSARKFFVLFFFMRRAAGGAGKGLWGLKIVGQVQEVWLSHEHQGDPVIQTNSKHTGGFGESVGKIVFLLLESKPSLCHAVRVTSFPQLDVLQSSFPPGFLSRCRAALPNDVFCFSKATSQKWEAADQMLMPKLSWAFRSLLYVAQFGCLHILFANDPGWLVRPNLPIFPHTFPPILIQPNSSFFSRSTKTCHFSSLAKVSQNVYCTARSHHSRQHHSSQQQRCFLQTSCLPWSKQ